MTHLEEDMSGELLETTVDSHVDTRYSHLESWMAEFQSRFRLPYLRAMDEYRNQACTGRGGASESFNEGL